MKITFLGATKTVTGSKYLIETASQKILVDCGLFQGYKELRIKNWAPFPVDPKKIDAVILTHAHLDHSGYLPRLAKNGFKGPIYCSPGTNDFCNILLPDSGYLNEEDARRANKYGYSKHKPALPLYTIKDADKVLKQFQVIDYEKRYELKDNLSFEFHHAGHILGASFITISDGKRSILFSGDIGRPVDPIMKAPDPIISTDYLVVESTYGNRLHEQTDPMDKLETIINDTVINKKGILLVPAFAVGRTQILLYYIYQLKLAKRIPNIPVYIDSPMAMKATKISHAHAEKFRITTKECLAICSSAKYSQTQQDSKALDLNPEPKIIISASGMATGGRVLHHLKIFLRDERNTVLFVGYQAGGTRGDRLLRGETEIKIHGEMIPVKARIESLSNLSAHSDYSETLAWLEGIKKAPREVFITHGEPSGAESLKEKIEKKFHWKCLIPDYLQSVKL